MLACYHHMAAPPLCYTSLNLLVLVDMPARTLVLSLRTQWVGGEPGLAAYLLTSLLSSVRHHVCVVKEDVR